MPPFPFPLPFPLCERRGGPASQHAARSALLRFNDGRQFSPLGPLPAREGARLAWIGVAWTSAQGSVV